MLKLFNHLLERTSFVLGHPMNRNHKLVAVWRFIKWQSTSRITNSDKHFSWIGNTKFKVRRGESGLTMSIYTGLQEFPEMGFLLHFLRNQDTFLDVGANIGSYTILGAFVCKSNVIALEPHPKSYQRLRENVALNLNGGSVDLIQVGAGAKKGFAMLTEELDSKNFVVESYSKGQQTVEIVIDKLDSIVKRNIPTLIKIDVEGYEIYALKGARNILADDNCNAIILEINSLSDRYDTSESDLLKFLSDFKFYPYKYDPITRSLDKINGINLEQTNTIFIKDFDFVKSRIHSSKKLSWFGLEF
jgi:FkbM family methyltransferase